MQPRDRYQAERRLNAWRSFFAWRPGTHEAPLEDLRLFVQYIDYIKTHSKHNTLHIPSIIIGAVLGGTIVLTVFLIFG